MFNTRTYLDCAAGLEDNPSSPHTEGRVARKKLEDARTTIARSLEVQADDVIFTSGATESNALAILGVVHACGNDFLTPSGSGSVFGQPVAEKIVSVAHVLYLPSAHASIVENAKLLAEKGIEVEVLPIKNWQVDCERLKKMLRPETKLVSMEAVCGETGVIWNTREVAEVLKKARRGKGVFSLTQGTVATREENAFPAPLLHVDASQAPLTEKITRAHFDADLLTFDGSKVGVRGIGALVAHRTISIEPLYKGGGQERELRPGTENPESAARFAAALSDVVRKRESFTARAKRARISLIDSISSQIPGILINEGREQVPNILNLSLPGRDTDYLVALLDEAGFAVSTRSACESDSQSGSRAVLALTGDSERARSTVRISWCSDTSARALRRFSKALVREVAFIDSNASG